MRNPLGPVVFGALFSALVFALPVAAQDEGESAGGAAQANNPLANMTAFNMHNYYIGDVSETDEDADQFWFRYAKPFSAGDSNWLFRASLPVNSFPVAGSHTTGMGDLNLFAAYLIDVGNPAVSFGIGPQVTAPTATEDATGSGKWSGGLVNVLFNGESPKFQYGYLASWQDSFAGSSNREDAHLAVFQPFAFYQLGDGLYLRASPIWVYNLENDSYSVPVGVGLGKVMKRGNTVFNLFVEPQFSIADDGPGQPEWQVFVGFNMQFLGN